MRRPIPLARRCPPALLAALCILASWLSGMANCRIAAGGEARLLRAINLNGPAMQIDGQAWEGDDAKNLRVQGRRFENQEVPLTPRATGARATMLRSSVWGNQAKVELTGLGDKPLRVCLYLWEDNANERFDVLLNGRVVARGVESGAAGNWKRLGPFAVQKADGTLTIAFQGGAANLSGVEIWSSEGEVPSWEAAAFESAPTPEQIAFFEKRIRPLLVDRCYGCHSAEAAPAQGGLLLDSRAAIVRGGDQGAVIVPGEPEASPLIRAVRRGDPALLMPPEEPLSPEEIADLERWVRERAPDPRMEDTLAIAKSKSAIDWEEARQWWSFRPLAETHLPEVKDAGWPQSAIDRYLLAAMEREQLAPAPDAEKRTLIRRASFDLTGLPPSPEEVAAFLADESPEAFAKLVDRLLSSPRYGERWGRHWLDVVRYADTAGDNSDFPIPQMRHYRDWVIQAINEDLPYDQFVQAQLAGDLLPDGLLSRREALVATGYIATARRFGSRVEDYPQHLTIEDTLDNLGKAFLGLSISCARCHDHKFDPIPTSDYYALYGIFQSTQYPWPGIELDQQQRRLIPLAPPAAVEAFEKEKAERQKELMAIVEAKEKSAEAAQGDEKKRLEAEELEARKKATQNARRLPPYEMIFAVAEAADRGDAVVQVKGDPARPGEVVPRGFLTVLGGQKLAAEDASSGRRALAKWVTEERNPLFARVMVNRIWLHHFGRGLTPTPNDFGKQGRPPTHPELLDYLAREFIRSGWSLKAMHRTIMLSRTYRLSSVRSPESVARDPANLWLASFPRRRIDAESLRDALLTLGDSLDLNLPPEHPFPPQAKWNFTQHNPFRAAYDSNHRSVYLMTQRIQRRPFLAIFDGADPSVSTPLRGVTTTPLQALFLLNDPLVHEQAHRFGDRLQLHADIDEDRIAWAFEQALARPPTDEERDGARRFLAAARAAIGGEDAAAVEQEAWRAFARVIFRLNEFCYLD